MEDMLVPFILISFFCLSFKSIFLSSIVFGRLAVNTKAKAYLSLQKWAVLVEVGLGKTFNKVVFVKVV